MWWCLFEYQFLDSEEKFRGVVDWLFLGMVVMLLIY